MKTAILICCILALAGCGRGNWDVEKPIEAPKDIRLYLQQVPAASKYAYGNSDRTLIFYNLIIGDEKQTKSNKQIEELRAEISELKELINSNKKEIEN